MAARARGSWSCRATSRPTRAPSRSTSACRRLGQALGATLGAESAVGGPAATLADYNDVASSRLPIIVIVLTLVTALLLGILLRSIVVPIVGVVLNLLAVGATLGLLALLFQGDNPLLGGPGVIDAVAVTAIFGVVFALSMDYQVFILSRVREEWLRTGDEAQALEVGMTRTARVVTGAALSMLGVFVAFALADVASLRQFGVGLAIAIVIDATLVRLVLLPAALRFAGDYAWYVPGFEYDRAGSRAPRPARPSTCRRLEGSGARLALKARKPPGERGFPYSGGGIRTRDLRVMSPTSYQTAPPRGVDVTA